MKTNNTPRNMKQSASFLLRVAAVILTAAALTASCGAAVMVTPVDWATETSGNIGPIGVTLSNISTPFGAILTDFYLFGDITPFAAAPLPPNSESIQYTSASNWTATFSQPVNDLFLYVFGWRGNHTSEADPASTYTLNQAFTVFSGLQDITQSGNTLTIPDSGGGVGFHSGILQFTGPVSSISVVANTPSGAAHAQVLTFAIPVPEPSAATLTCLGGLYLIKRCRRKSAARRNA